MVPTAFALRNHTQGLREKVTLTELTAITLKKIFLTGFSEGQGLTGLIAHLGREWVVLANLFLLPRPHKEQAQRIERSQE